LPLVARTLTRCRFVVSVCSIAEEVLKQKIILPMEWRDDGRAQRNAALAT
jgi:hypothetical protein